MKQLIIIVTILMLSISAKAKTDSLNIKRDSVYIWNKWCEKKDTLLLFTASYNVIKVYCTWLNPADIYLKSLDKTLKISGEEIEADTLTMLAMPYQTEKPTQLAVINKKNNKVIKTIAFNGVDVPEPKARLGYIKDFEANKDNILAQVGLKVYFPNSLYSYPYRVKEYSFKTYYDKADVKIDVKGRLVNKDIEQAIIKTPSGSIIEFANIKVTCKECITKSIDDLRIKIK